MLSKIFDFHACSLLFRSNLFHRKCLQGENKPTIPLAIENFSSVEGFDVYASILRESENDVKRGTEGADNPEEEEEKEQEKGLRSFNESFIAHS